MQRLLLVFLKKELVKTFTHKPAVAFIFGFEEESITVQPAVCSAKSFFDCSIYGEKPKQRLQCAQSLGFNSSVIKQPALLALAISFPR